MLRSFFFAFGMFVVFCGCAFMSVDKVVFHSQETQQRDPNYRGFFTSVNENRQHVFNPPLWAAFGMLSFGSVTMLYAVALPKMGQHRH